jgi:hypothetical protein
MTNKHPRLRSHVRRRKSGKVVTYYVYDRRPEGEPDIALGTDYDEALKRWDEIHNRAPRIAGTLMEAFEKFEREELTEAKYPSKETRSGYARHLKQLKPAFGGATWDGVDLVDLRAYLDARSAKTQGNREMAMLSIVWNKARLWGLTKLPFPAAGMERSKWKNKEHARTVEVTDELFNAIYPHGDQLLRDAMDLASATGLRLTDCRTVAIPRGGVLRCKASKTGKKADFDVNLSEVLPGLIKRRSELLATHTMLLSTEDGRPVSKRMLSDRWAAARAAAADAARAGGNPDLATEIEGLILRDMRKRAANLAESDEAARDLLDHADVNLTRKHYRTVVKLKRPVR